MKRDSKSRRKTRTIISDVVRPVNGVGGVGIDHSNLFKRVLVEEELTGVYGRAVSDEGSIGGDVAVWIGLDVEVSSAARIPAGDDGVHG